MVQLPLAPEPPAMHRHCNSEVAPGPLAALLAQRPAFVLARRAGGREAPRANPALRWASVRSWIGCLALTEDQLISVSFLAAAGA